ncbi:hypothetical protein M3J09_011781 [Ascochyta lentis]
MRSTAAQELERLTPRILFHITVALCTMAAMAPRVASQISCQSSPWRMLFTLHIRSH